jgi:class 3 adenylate cyclase
MSGSNRADASPFFLYHDDLGAQQVFLLEDMASARIGRGNDADLRLAWDRSISLIHAEVVRLGRRWLIADEGISRNGTFVNDKRLGGRRRLRDGDAVRVGRTTLAFHDAGSRADTTTILEDVRLTDTVTFLFTDLVGSTEALTRLGDDAWDGLRREHFSILRRATAEHDGQEVKSLGDGLMIAFSSALNAVACAKRMQEQIAEHGGDEAAGLRVGLNAGEVISAEGDYYGAPVVLAKRLCDRATPGQTLLSDVVRALVGNRGGFRFVSLGAVAVKGFPEAPSVFELELQNGA